MPGPASERAQLSTRLFASLIALLLLAVFIGWFAMHGTAGLHWSSVQRTFPTWFADSDPFADDLPYITAVPLVPNPERTVLSQQVPESEQNQMVVLSEHLRNEPVTPQDLRPLKRR